MLVRKLTEALNEVLGIAGQLRRHGPCITPNGVVFNLWGPTAQSVELLERGQMPRRMPRDADGWYQTVSATAHVGTRYQFRINGDLIVPIRRRTFSRTMLENPAKLSTPLLCETPFSMSAARGLKQSFTNCMSVLSHPKAPMLASIGIVTKIKVTQFLLSGTKALLKIRPRIWIDHALSRDAPSRLGSPQP